ncbi:MAG: transglutaminase domain-containing protein [Bacteroidia bacterium]
MKKRIACFLCLITLCSVVFSQNWSSKHFRKIDKWANQTPDEVAVTVPLLATYLTKQAETEEDKVRAIYIWIANHIHYDDSTFAQIDNFYVKEESDSVDMQSPETVLKRRIALCEGYARLFKALCQQVGIRSEVVIGYCKEEGGALADIAHAWNVVEVRKEWYMLDVTWGSGMLDAKLKRYVRKINDAYFLLDKSLFLKDHFPLDPMWQLSENLVSEADFTENWKSHATQLSQFPAYQDSIKAWFLMSYEAQKKAEVARCLRYYPENIYCIFSAYAFTLAEISSQIQAIIELLRQVEEEGFDPTIAEELKNKNQSFAQSLSTLEKYFTRLEVLLKGREKTNLVAQHYRVDMPRLKTYQCYALWKARNLHLLAEYEESETEYEEEERAYLLEFWKKLRENDRQMYEAYKGLHGANADNKQVNLLQQRLPYDMLSMEINNSNLLYEWLRLHLVPENIIFVDTLRLQHTKIQALYGELVNVQKTTTWISSDSMQVLQVDLQKAIALFEFELAEIPLMILRQQVGDFSEKLGEETAEMRMKSSNKVLSVLEKYELAAANFQQEWINSTKGNQLKTQDAEVYQKICDRFFYSHRFMLHTKFYANMLIMTYLLQNAEEQTTIVFETLTKQAENIEKCYQQVKNLEPVEIGEAFKVGYQRMKKDSEELFKQYYVQQLQLKSLTFWSYVTQLLQRQGFSLEDEKKVQALFQNVEETYQSLIKLGDLSPEELSIINNFFHFYKAENLLGISELYRDRGLKFAVDGDLTKAYQETKKALTYISQSEKELTLIVDEQTAGISLLAIQDSINAAKERVETALKELE